MQDLKPYIVVEDNDSRLYIKEAGWRNNLHFFVFRILPFFFLCEAAVIFTLLNNKTEIPKGALVFIILATCVPAAILFTRKYITAIVLTPLAIELSRNSFKGKEQNVFAISDVDHIRYRKRSGKGGGYFYYLVFKTGGRERFVKFPLFGMTDEKKQFIGNKLKRVTGLDIQNS